MRAKYSKIVPKQGLPVLHERAVAPVSVQVLDPTPRQGPPVSYAEAVDSVRPVEDITPRQGSPANSAEAVASVRPVVNRIRVSVSQRRIGAARVNNPLCRRVLPRLLRLWNLFM